MSRFKHCDGPDCTQTRDQEFDERPYLAPAWLTVEREGRMTLDFHSSECLAKWAAR